MNRSRTLRAALPLLAAALCAPRASADDISLMVEPRYDAANREFTDQSGSRTTVSDRTLVQGYRLSLDRTLLPGLRFSGMGLLEDRKQLGAGAAGGFRTTGANGNLGFGTRILGGNAGYSHREERDRLSGSQGARLNDMYSLALGWAPEGAPSMSLRLNRSDVYDRARLLQDTTTDQAGLSARWVPDTRRRVDAGLSYSSLMDHLNGATARTYGGSMLAGWNDTIFGGRTSASASYSLAAKTSETVATGEGGIVSTQQLPAPGYGLSSIDEVTANPGLTTLERNAALVDGNMTASANVNIGYRASVTGDTRLRELGAEFPDASSEVNVVAVWVDRQLRENVTAALAMNWAVFRSDDNINWTPVALAGRAFSPPFENRFDIPIQPTAARFLKVVTRPLAAGITVEDQYADIFVTELQFYRRTPAADVRGRTGDVMNQVNVSGRTPIPAVSGLAHDFSGIARRSDGFGDQARPSMTVGAITNGLSLVRKLSPSTLWSSRVMHQDTYDTRGYDGSLAWASSLGLRPIETFSNTLSYSGSLRHGIQGVSLQNSVSVLNRAQVYRWFGVDTTAGGSVTSGGTTGSLQSGQVTVTGNLVPHRFLNLSGGWRLRRTWGAVESRAQSAEAAAAFSPTQSTSISASVIRIIEGPRPTTLGSVSLGLSPFQGGALELRFTASRSLDSTAEQISTVIAPGMRWNIRTGWYFDVGYNFLDLEAPTGRTRTRELSASLLAVLF